MYNENIIKNTQVVYNTQNPYNLTKPQSGKSNSAKNVGVNDEAAINGDILQKIDEANQRASQIIGDANAKARSILSAAGLRAQELMSMKQEEGYAQGCQNAERLLNEKLIEISRLKAQLNDHFQESIKSIQVQILDLSLSFAKDIIYREISRDDTVIQSMASGLMEKFRNEKDITLQVSSHNAEILRAADLKNAKIQECAELEDDELLMNTENGTIDASVSVRLENLKEELKKVE